MESIPKGIDRRRFLKLGAAASALAIGCRSSGERQAEGDVDLPMRYRPLGDTGLRVSEITFGSAGFENPALLLAALDAGITTISTGDNIGYGRADELIGDVIRNLGSRRDQLVLCAGDVIRRGTTKQQILDSIDGQLRRLRTDHVEVFRTGGVTSPDDLLVDSLFEAFEAAKQAGKVRHLALAGHSGGMQSCLNAGIDDGRFEAFFTKYDFVSYPDQDQILQRAAERGIGSVVFKVNAGNRQREIRDLEAGGLSFRQATVKWALTHPYVASVCVGITNFDQIREYTAAVGAPLSEAETAPCCADMLTRCTTSTVGFAELSRGSARAMSRSPTSCATPCTSSTTAARSDPWSCTTHCRSGRELPPAIGVPAPVTPRVRSAVEFAMSLWRPIGCSASPRRREPYDWTSPLVCCCAPASFGLWGKER
jgi:aryl-alcohol dehydrogenase-like predicted oxidoreductase